MKRFINKILVVSFIFVLIGVITLIYPMQQIYAGLLSSASIQLSSSVPSATAVTYTTVFTFSGTTSIKCMNIVFATSADMTGGVPTGMTTTSSVKGTISGGGLTDANWALTNTTNGTLSYKYATGGTTTATAVTIPTTTITNTSISTFYAQVTTYSNTDCSTGQVDQSNVIALTTQSGVTTSVTVQPTLTFSVANYGTAVNGSGDASPVTTTASTVPLGTVAAGATAWGSQTLTASTNASHGYTLYVRDSVALTNPNSDTLRDQSGTPASANSFDGTTSQSSFAYTADGNGVAFGSNKWAGLAQTNTSIAVRAAAINSDPTHVEYKVEVSNTQPPGAYTTVIVYTATPSY